MITPRQLKELCDNGENISAYLRKHEGIEENSQRIIEIAYDLQAGSYVAAMQDREMVTFKIEYCRELAGEILRLCKPDSVLEAGIGEGTTLSYVLKHFDPGIRSFGFDLCWSRIYHARQWLKEQGYDTVSLCTGDLLDIPYHDNSFDVVYTSHSIEPNGGNELPILKELYRVARKYILLLEPGYELASEDAKRRMRSHGYCKGLPSHCKTMGWDVQEHRLFPFSVNPLNPTAITIIAKNSISESVTPGGEMACPQYKTPLATFGNVMFSPEALSAYPIIDGIPCLRKENAVIASQFSRLLKDHGDAPSPT